MPTLRARSLTWLLHQGGLRRRLVGSLLLAPAQRLSERSSLRGGDGLPAGGPPDRGLGSGWAGVDTARR